MTEKQIRLLRADEIECRVGTLSEKGASLLLYKDARADMRILDETFGPMGWQRRHELIGGNLYCTVSVWDAEKEQWISKSDVGTESYTEKEKGQASDSFKRACVSFGIGRELYSAPFIWVGASKLRMEEYNGKLIVRDRFRVADISYGDNREITGLTIMNQDGKVVYSLKASAARKKPEDSDRKESSEGKQERNTGGAPDTETVNSRKITGNTRSRQSSYREQEVDRELVRTGVALDTVLARYGVSSVQDMDDEVYRKAISSLRKTKTKAA